jgi:SAM-dependent methyltransferase
MQVRWPVSDPDTARFYDELAPFYPWLYPDWDGAVSRQGMVLSNLLAELGVTRSDIVLDAACGVGTQALGLLGQGHRVVASDLSAGAVARFKAQLERRGLHAEARVDDMRELASMEPGSAAAVMACDNSVPHLLSDADIARAFASFQRVLKPGGWMLVSVRDYASIERKNPDVRPYGLRRDGDRRFLAVQVWEWDGDQYDLRMYLTSEDDGACETRVLTTRYYAVTIERLMQLMAVAGFIDIRRRNDVLFQPVLIGRRPASA